MELYQLRTFVTVAQQGHLTQAAELLHLSQPAVTAQIKALEEDIGTALFERTASGLKMTQAGQELLPQAQGILASARGVIHWARDLRGQLSGKAYIGVTISSRLLRLGPWVSALTRKYPLLELKLRKAATGDVLNMVRKKEMDAGFYLGKNPYSNVNSLRLTDFNYRLMCPAAWADELREASGKELGKRPWIGLSQFSSLNKITAEVWRDLNISPKKVTECDHSSAVIELVAHGIGLGLVREADARIAVEGGSVVWLPQVCKSVDLSFVYPADCEDDPILMALLEELKPLWGLV